MKRQACGALLLLISALVHAQEAPPPPAPVTPPRDVRSELQDTDLTATNNVYVGNRLAVGTTDPLAQIHVVGNVSAANPLRFTNTGVSPNKTWHFSGVGNDFAFAETGININLLLRQGGGVSLPTGFLGIGTSNAPGASVDVFATPAKPVLRFGGFNFFNGGLDPEGTAVLHYYSSANNRQIMFADSTELQSNTIPGIRFILGNPGYAEINAATPNGAVMGKNLVFNSAGGNVGIGITLPADRLHIAGTGTGPTAPGLLIQNTTTGSTHAAATTIQRGDAAGYAQVNYNNGATTHWAAGLRAGDSNYHIYDAASFTDRVVISPTGVSVTGDISATGVIHAKFQDLAEWVPATESIPAGTVVVVAPRNHVSPSTDAYDTRVAGVVSAQPGIALGEAGDSKVLVATTGRVKVRVDAANGPIREGDILVSSPIKGTAMKSEPIVISGRKFHQPGTVIGKALEPLERGTGEILVLLSMQ